MRESRGEILAPGAFLPIAEQWGLTADIDGWDILRAIESAAGSGPTELNLGSTSAFCETQTHLPGR